MTKAINTLRKLRLTILKGIEGLTTEQLNKIPEGYNNNIIWNLGHLVAGQQGICYTRAGLSTPVEESFVNAYKPGTKPQAVLTGNEIEEIKALLFSSIDKLEKDYNDGIFKEYPAFTTRYDIELASIEDGISFLPFHDGFHMGYIMALKRAL